MQIMASNSNDGQRMIYSRIAGTGSYLPKKILTNADLEHGGYYG